MWNEILEQFRQRAAKLMPSRRAAIADAVLALALMATVSILAR